MFSKFSRNEYNDDKQYYENLVDVLNKSGVRVIWRDNNSGRSKGVADRVADAKYFGGENIYDEVMLGDLQQSIDAGYEDTFVVLHQEGSHGPTYYKRYPDNFKKFKPTCDTQDLE
jgi:lipid A ethanolaminephosphotransferase